MNAHLPRNAHEEMSIAWRWWGRMAMRLSSRSVLIPTPLGIVPEPLAPELLRRFKTFP